jgi:hypothetical protein
VVVKTVLNEENEVPLTKLTKCSVTEKWFLFYARNVVISGENGQNDGDFCLLLFFVKESKTSHRVKT